LRSLQTSAGNENEITEDMKAEEAIKHMDQIIAESVNEFGMVMLQVAQSANTLMKQRIVETGMDAEGKPFAPYSTKPMLTNCKSKYMSVAVCNQLAGSKEKRKELKWVTVKNAKLFEIDGGYKEFRELHGRRTDIVDFNWTGEMWANVQVTSSEDEHRTGLARISTLSETENAKLAGNTDRKGEILMLNDSEVNVVSDILEEWLAAKWNE